MSRAVAVNSRRSSTDVSEVNDGGATLLAAAESLRG